MSRRKSSVHRRYGSGGRTGQTTNIIVQIYHPNIDTEGNVCLNILRDDWKPVLTINSICFGLQFLFSEPNPDDPLNKGMNALRRDAHTSHCASHSRLFFSFSSGGWWTRRGGTGAVEQQEAV